MLDSLDKDITSKENIIIEQIKTFEEAKSKKKIASQQCYIMKKLQRAMQQKPFQTQEKTESIYTNLCDWSIVYIAGIADKKDIMLLRRMIFRTTKGNALITSEDMVNRDAVKNEKEECFFTIAYSEEENY
jgi:V-type ATPase 116kDa subunit family